MNMNRINVIALGVRDMEKSIRFYRDGLGFQTGAIENGRVNQKLCRNNTYGKTKRGFDTVDCNCCRTACPMNYGDNHKINAYNI
ncbi:hypothetical protein EZS27_022547 [termite gut metagenome]|uniref:Glyoxalase/fosfomycin resistance/dioxygenase domain-containing protein n=1 Tax=termite gut metagenome TaxID=433724 RepID=A0A5J4R606_9ZZZZ